MDEVFECSNCGATLFFLLFQLPLHGLNASDVRKTKIYACMRCRVKFQFVDGMWEKL